MIFGHLLWTPRMCVDNPLLLPLATTGTRLSRSVLRATRCWRRNWSRRMENNDKMLETELEMELDVRHGNF